MENTPEKKKRFIDFNIYFKTNRYEGFKLEKKKQKSKIDWILKYPCIYTVDRLKLIVPKTNDRTLPLCKKKLAHRQIYLYSPHCSFDITVE